MTLKELLENLRESDVFFKDAIESGLIPKSVLHHFACDCAEKVFQLEKEHGEEIPEDAWQAVKIKRLWVEGRVTDDELHEAAWKVVNISYRYRSVYWASQIGAAPSAYWSCLRSADRPSHWKVAKTRSPGHSIYWSFHREEKQKNINHLIFLIEEYMATQLSLLSILIKRKEQLRIQLEVAVPVWQKETEDYFYSNF